MDQAAEALIREPDRRGPARRRDPRRGGRRDRWPGAGGCGRSGRAGAAVRWIVDPLDGTVNYLYGLPDWAVSIAAEVDGTVVAGAVFVPRRDELFSASARRRRVAELGSPGLAWRGRRPPVRLACNTGVPLDQALVATGFGYAAGRRLVQGEVLRARAAAGAGHPARRVGRRGPVLGGLGQRGRLLRARRQPLGHRGGRPDRAPRPAPWSPGCTAGPPSPSMTLAAAPPLLGELHDLLAEPGPGARRLTGRRLRDLLRVPVALGPCLALEAELQRAARARGERHHAAAGTGPGRWPGPASACRRCRTPG